MEIAKESVAVQRNRQKLQAALEKEKIILNDHQEIHKATRRIWDEIARRPKRVLCRKMEPFDGNNFCRAHTKYVQKILEGIKTELSAPALHHRITIESNSGA